MRIGKYVNDAPGGFANCIMKLIMVRNIPRLCLFAKKDIEAGAELHYNYGEDPGLLWWRKEVIIFCLTTSVYAYRCSFIIFLI